MNPLDRLKERYQNDPEFHAIVDMLYHKAFGSLGYTPQEVRDAATLASLMWAADHVEPVYLNGLWYEYAPDVRKPKPTEDL